MRRASRGTGSGRSANVFGKEILLVVWKTDADQAILFAQRDETSPDATEPARRRKSFADHA